MIALSFGLKSRNSWNSDRACSAPAVRFRCPHAISSSMSESWTHRPHVELEIWISTRANQTLVILVIGIPTRNFLLLIVLWQYKENIYETLRPYLIKYNCRRVLRHTVTYDTACYKYDGALAGRGGRGRAGARAVVRTSRVLPRALVLPIPRQDQVCFPTVTCILFSPTDQIALEPGPALHDRRQHCGWVLRC